MSSSPKSARGGAKGWVWQGLRFIAAGAMNTLGTILLYQLLLFLLPYGAAYTLAWLAGLVFVNVAYPRFVYRKPAVTRRDTLLNSAFYLLSFGASYVLLYLFTSALQWPPRLSIFAVLLITVPANFLITRWVYRPGGSTPAERG